MLLVFIALVVAFATWPRGWARDLARVAVDSCYGDQLQANFDNCGTSKHQFMEEEAKWGRLRSYRIVSVRQNFFYQSYRITVEGRRGNVDTTEEILVSIGGSAKTGPRWRTHIDEALIRHR